MSPNFKASPDEDQDWLEEPEKTEERPKKPIGQTIVTKNSNKVGAQQEKREAKGRIDEGQHGKMMRLIFDEKLNCFYDPESESYFVLN